MGGGSNLAPPPTGYRRAIARSAVQKQPERRALRPQARFGAQPPQAALGAEIGCSSVTPPPNRRRMGGGSNLALLLGGEQQTPHHRQQAIATPRKVGTSREDRLFLPRPQPPQILTQNLATPHQKEGQPC